MPASSRLSLIGAIGFSRLWISSARMHGGLRLCNPLRGSLARKQCLIMVVAKVMVGIMVAGTVVVAMVPGMSGSQSNAAPTVVVAVAMVEMVEGRLVVVTAAAHADVVTEIDGFAMLQCVTHCLGHQR